MLTLTNINKKFKNKNVIENFNMELSKGDVVLLKGPNGCGKTTLLKMIAGLIKPTEGTICFSENVNIGALIENPAFIEFKSLKYNLEFLYNLKSKYNEEIVNALCKRLYLDLFNKDPMKTYSIGMRQKAGFIQAIMENQNVVLLDEPTRGLDESSLQAFNILMGEMSSSHDKLILIAAHDGVSGVHFNKKIEMK